MNTATREPATTWVPNEPPSVDWLGRSLECGSCVNQGLLTEGKCQLAFSCVFDRYAKRIDRFFRWNPGLANDYLEHPYFEVRAVASRSADVFRLVGLMHDPDETVRLHVALRLPQRLLAELRNDPDREVRIRVAQRLDASMLVEMAGDPDYFVRKLVAQRLPLPLLPRMATDPDQEVRLAVASRLQVPALLALRNDPEVAVRRVVVDRLPIGLLADMADDPAWEVRWEVAQRADPSLARRLLHDDEAEVCEAARLRLTTLDSEARHG